MLRIEIKNKKSVQVKKNWKMDEVVKRGEMVRGEGRRVVKEQLKGRKRDQSHENITACRRGGVDHLVAMVVLCGIVF